MDTEEKAIYGYDLDPALREVLTAPVPTDAVAWVEQVVGSSVVAERALLGGTSSAMHLLSTAAAPPLDRLVLRRYVLDWVREEPEIPGNEALALRLVENGAIGVPAPRLVASDPDGSALGVPVTLMTALSGTPVWHPVDRTTWLRSLAELVVRIHAEPLSADLADWAPYAPDARTPPAWSRHPDAWLTAYELWDGPTPPSERVFLHRDYHPGNILWTEDEITGVVDWTSSCAGPPEEDIGHCRANLAIRHGQDWAEEFLAIWQGLTGKRDYHPYWDLTNVVSFDHTQVEPRLDQFVATAAARLPGRTS
ncbi:MAG TPA: aminoglycoside phosphotransferase family protein [Microlunatus sp.]|nr:aminoglycoside phosphotransferase family protein [Microlunatus sp.]